MPEECGRHADAARTAEAHLAELLRASVEVDRAVPAPLRDAYAAALRGRRRLDAIEAEIDAVVASQPTLAGSAGACQFQMFLVAKAREVEQVVADATADDDAKAAQVQALGGRYSTDDRHKPTIQAVDNRTDRTPASEEDRRQNQIDAFTQVFGRSPESAADWTTAAALDPHTYDPLYQGVNSEIRVARIDPVPGQGVVRMSQWIAQRDVLSGPRTRNFGNDRGPDMHFDPEHTKVTTYIDYENGIVVMRQNPSVELTKDGGPGLVRVSAPTGTVTQANDGSVRIKYDAGNPFAPRFATDPNGPLHENRLSVNGDLVFTPGNTGIFVNGIRTNYPSLEIYQDLPNGATRPVLIEPAPSGSSLAPLLNLPHHHEIGLGAAAFAPFDNGEWSPTGGPNIPLPVAELEPVTISLPASTSPAQMRVPA